MQAFHINYLTSIRIGLWKRLTIGQRLPLLVTGCMKLPGFDKIFKLRNMKWIYILRSSPKIGEASIILKC